METELKKLSSGKKIVFLSLIWLFIFLFTEVLLRVSGYFFGWESRYWFEYGEKPYISFFKSPSMDPKTNIIVRGGTDKYGFRLDSNDDPNRDLTRKLPQQYRIFLLGGSTVDGRYLGNVDGTLSARLESLLQEQFPQRDIEVINAGNSGFISVQELSLYLYYIGKNLQPDHVIFFNGSNDFANWPNSELPEIPGLRGNIHERGAQFYIYSSQTSSWLSSFDYIFRNIGNHSKTIYFFREGVVALIHLFRKYDSQDKIKLETEELWLHRHIDRYVYNMTSSLQLANRDTHITYILQPTLLPETPLSYKEHVIVENFRNSREYSWHGYDYLTNKQNFYDQMRDIFRRLPAENICYAQTADLSLLFLNKNSNLTVFADHVHYLPEGRRIISTAIFDLVNSRIKDHIESDFFQKNCH
jgi:hypothetical protein